MAQDKLFRTAIGILWSDRVLSRDMRNWLVMAIEVLDKAQTELEMVESVRRGTASPFASDALDAMKVLQDWGGDL